MRQGNKRRKSAGGFILACLVLLGGAGFAGFGVALSTYAARSSGPSPYDSDPSPNFIVATRFTPDVDASRSKRDTAPAYRLASLSTEPQQTQEPAMFSPVPSYPSTTVALEPATEPTTQSIPSAIPSAPPAGTAAKPDALRAPAPAAAAVHHPSGRPNSVLNDAQIASIKKRLNLTPDQESMWPAVEAALRAISYSKNPAAAPSRATPTDQRLAYVDPNSPEVQKLKSAAFPLIMRLNYEQKNEVRMMAHVMGLEQVASSF